MAIFKPWFKKRGYICWGALFLSAIVGVGVNFLLNLFSLALGIASFSVQSNGATHFSIAGFLFFCLSAFIAMFLTGWLGGRLTPRVLYNKYWGILYGFTAWSILLIFTIILLTNFIQYASFHTNFTSNLVEIKIMADSPMLTTTTSHHIAQSPLGFNIETHHKIIRLNAALTFLLFFMGAMSSCLGGYLGYSAPVLREHKT